MKQATNRMLDILSIALFGLLFTTSVALGQQRPYIGYVYPAGGQQNTTIVVKLGGQTLDGTTGVLLTGEGVSGRIVEYLRKLGNQELTLLREQLRILKRADRDGGRPDTATRQIIANIEKRIAEYVARPASNSISSLAFAEINIAADAPPGTRELRLVTERGVTNPLVFEIGQVPEYTRKAMMTSQLQVLGKEQLALRKRPDDEVEVQVEVPCAMNGQIASGEVNWYRFEARKGQRLVISTQARHLIPYIADAVPGWFQPVLAVYDGAGKELAYDDDYRFKPDPVIFFEVPEDGEYRLSITDAIYRGREDFVYRVTISELPFITSIFPLGTRVGETPSIEMAGWNLDGAQLILPLHDSAPGICSVTAQRDHQLSNSVPFIFGTLPECLDTETNNDLEHAQQVKLPMVVNGRIDRREDWDVFRFAGQAGQKIVVEVMARRLDSPVDALVKLTDASGSVLAFSDDREDLGSGLNTHHADSYLLFELPAAGDYYVHLGDTAQNGGPEYAYRLRISAPQPDFELRVAPSSVALRGGRSSAALDVYAIRRDGFTGDIKVGMKDPAGNFTSNTVTLSDGKDKSRLGVRTRLRHTPQPVDLLVEGRATIDGRDVVHAAVPAEDRMQAFLWRHLVPAEDLKAMVISGPAVSTLAQREPPAEAVMHRAVAAIQRATETPKFTKQQVRGRLRQLKMLYDEWLLTEPFYAAKVAECEAVQ